MKIIGIPVEVKLVTVTVTTFRYIQKQIQVGRQRQTQTERVQDVQTVEPGRDEAGVRRDFQRVNQIWNQANIVFLVRAIDGVRWEAPDRYHPPGVAVDRAALDRGGLIQLLAQFK